LTSIPLRYGKPGCQATGEEKAQEIHAPATRAAARSPDFARRARLFSTAAVAGRAGKEGAVNIELAVVIVVFGPIILIRFLRSLANHARRARAKVPAAAAPTEAGMHLFQEGEKSGQG